MFNSHRCKHQNSSIQCSTVIGANINIVMHFYQWLSNWCCDFALAFHQCGCVGYPASFDQIYSLLYCLQFVHTCRFNTRRHHKQKKEERRGIDWEWIYLLTGLTPNKKWGLKPVYGKTMEGNRTCDCSNKIYVSLMFNQYQVSS